MSKIQNQIDTVLVPQGFEYQAVLTGLKGKQYQTPQVLAIPIGSQSLSVYLNQWLQSSDFVNKQTKRVFLMGLCGGLSPGLRVGDMVIYQGCYDLINHSYQECSNLRLQVQGTVVKGLTSDRVIVTASEKRSLGQKYQTEVIDMEGFTTLKILSQAGISVSIIRVISDDCEHDLPDISCAIGSDGALKPLPLALKMLQNPVCATRLIRGSLTGLKVLQRVTNQLF